MHGFIFGALTVLGVITLARGLRYAIFGGAWRGRRGGCGHRGWHGRGRFGEDDDGPRRPRPMGERFSTDAGYARAMGEVLKRRLRVDEDQEDIVDHALKDLHQSVGELRAAYVDSRPDLAAAFRGEVVDEALLASVIARQDEAVKQARQDVTSAFKQIHAVLRPEQRERAADWLSGADKR
jgi:uncharacterized membrane protein